MSSSEKRKPGEKGRERGWTSKNGPWANAWSLPSKADAAERGAEKRGSEWPTKGGGDEAPS